LDRVVYLAWEPELARHVAVKLFPRNWLIDPHSREHWLSEARALCRVSHDNVVAIHRVGETEDWLWLVLEYVPGGTLKERLTGPLAPRAAAQLVETIARAVGSFHTRGVWHLDLKPSNVLLGGEPDRTTRGRQGRSENGQPATRAQKLTSLRRRIRAAG
jgi:serine/threonine protein kinase